MRPTQLEIKKAREAFQTQGTSPILPIQAKVLESWIRSREYGVTMRQADKSLLSAKQLKERIAARKEFFETASSILNGIYRFTTGSGFVSTIFDEDGYVLSVSGDEDILEIARANGLTDGCNRNEHNLGTNGIGTPLVIRDAIQISGEEHYFPPHYTWTCSGAPVFDPQGKVAGGICIIGTYENVSFHTLGMVSALAKAITQQLQMQDAYDELERAQQNINIMISTWPSGCILLDKRLRILKANRAAAQLLHTDIQRLEGLPLSDIMPTDLFNSKDIRAGISDRVISLEHKNIRLSVSVEVTERNDYVLLFEKAENLHKRITRIIGSEAKFGLDDIIGESAAMKEAIRMANVAAQNKANVLLKGESGTGKEVFAQAIHNASDRKNGPFVAINCGAIPKSLIESELFGYEGGSFTGAKKDGCPGKFELADGGTIFLDEIGDMPFEVQVNLLRVLQNREVSRIGSTKTVQIDVRVISATHQNLLEAIQRNQFRSDLYYRLNVFDIAIPPLRERTGDIALLADHFLQKYVSGSNARIQGISMEAQWLLESYHWPGNVRELENAVERAIYICQHGDIQREDFSLQMAEQKHALPDGPLPAGGKAATELLPFPESDRTRIERAIYTSGFNVKKAAELLGISRRTMYRKMERYGISRSDYLK